jgi:hypothetical protein
MHVLPLTRTSRIPPAIRAANQSSLKQVVKSRLNFVDVVTSEARHLSGCDRSPSAKNTKDDAIHVIGFLLVPERRDLHHDGQFPKVHRLLLRRDNRTLLC